MQWAYAKGTSRRMEAACSASASPPTPRAARLHRRCWAAGTRPGSARGAAGCCKRRLPAGTARGAAERGFWGSCQQRGRSSSPTTRLGCRGHRHPGIPSRPPPPHPPHPPLRTPGSSFREEARGGAHARTPGRATGPRPLPPCPRNNARSMGRAARYRGCAPLLPVMACVLHATPGPPPPPADLSCDALSLRHQQPPVALQRLAVERLMFHGWLSPCWLAGGGGGVKGSRVQAVEGLWVGWWAHHQPTTTGHANDAPRPPVQRRRPLHCARLVLPVGGVAPVHGDGGAVDVQLAHH